MRATSEAEHTRARRAVVRYNLRMAMPYVIFTLIAVLSISLAVALTISRSRQHDADFANAPLLAGTAVVNYKVFTYTKTGAYVDFRFLFRERTLNGKDSGGERSAFTNVGDTVPIIYRIGKSGAYDLVDWQAPPRKVPLSH